MSVSRLLCVEYLVTLRVSPQPVPRAGAVFGEQGRLTVQQAPPSDDEGWTRLVLAFEDLYRPACRYGGCGASSRDAASPR